MVKELPVVKLIFISLLKVFWFHIPIRVGVHRMTGVKQEELVTKVFAVVNQT